MKVISQKIFQCEVVSAETILYSGEATYLVASTYDGEMGVLGGHSPLLTQLTSGPVRIRQANGIEKVVYVESGFLEVLPHLVTVLADSILTEQF